MKLQLEIKLPLGMTLPLLLACAVLGCGGRSVAVDRPPVDGADAGGSAGSGTGALDAGPGGSIDAGPGGSADAGTGGGQDAGSGGGSGGGGGAGLTRLTTAGAAISLALDERTIYWVESYSTQVPDRPPQRSYSIQALRKDLATPPAALIREPGFAGSVVSNGGYLYWNWYQCTDFCNGAPAIVSRIPIAGGAVERLSTFFAAEGLDVDESFVYLANNNRPLKNEVWGGLWRIPKAGGTAEEIVPKHACTDAHVTGDLVLFNGISGITAWSRSAGKATALSTRPIPYRFLRPDGGSLFLASYYGQVERVPLGGGDARVLWKGPPASIADFDAQGGVAFWVQAASPGSKSCVLRGNADGSDVRCLDSAGTSYLAVRADAASVYFVRDGDVWRASR